MACSECQGKPVGKPCGTCGKLPPVLEIHNEECPILFHTVEVDGDSMENPPYMGQYKNVLLVFKGNGAKYLFSSDGIPSPITGDVDFNSLLNRPKYAGQTMTSETNIPSVEDETAAREAADTALGARIDTTDSNVAAEVAARVATDNTLQGNIDAEKTRAEAAESSLSSDIESLSSSLSSEAEARADADTNLQTQITAVDNATNRDVLTDLVLDPNTSTTVVQLDTTKTNLKTSVSTTDNIPLPVANATQAGVMNVATFNAVSENAANIEALTNGAVAITGLSGSVTQAQLTAAWEAETGLSSLMNRASIYDVTNEKVWTYYNNDNTWHAVSNTTQVTINTFTNTSEGTIKGSTNVGQVFAESDGTGSVQGWDALQAQADNATSKLATIESGAQMNVQSDWTETDSAADDYIKNKPTIDTTLSDSSTNAVTNAAITEEFEKVAYVGDDLSTPTSTAFVGTDNVIDGAITPQKISSATYQLETEQAVGTWIDGKTIYRYVLNVAVPAYNAGTSYGGVAIRALPFKSDTIISMHGTAPNASVAGSTGLYSHNVFPIPAYNAKQLALYMDVITNDSNNTNDQFALFNADSTNIFQGQVATIVLEYTKE